MMSLRESRCAVVLGAMLLACSNTMGQRPADSNHKPAPSLHEFWRKEADGVRQIRSPIPSALRQREADLAAFHVESYNGRAALAEVFRKSLTELLRSKPSIERSRLI